MKKGLLLFFIAVAVLASSCTTKQVVVPNQTIVTTVSSGSWASTDNGKTFSTNISVPEIDSYFNTHGGVLVYISFGGGVYEQVPEVYGGIAYSYTHSPGTLQLDIQDSNGSTVITPPGNITVKIVLIQSQ